MKELIFGSSAGYTTYFDQLSKSNRSETKITTPERFGINIYSALDYDFATVFASYTFDIVGELKEGSTIYQGHNEKTFNIGMRLFF